MISAATVASVAPYDADGLDFLAGMGEANIDEFNAALEGEAALRPFLDKEAAEMRGTTRDGLVAVMDTCFHPSTGKP